MQVPETGEMTEADKALQVPYLLLPLPCYEPWQSLIPLAEPHSAGTLILHLDLPLKWPAPVAL